MPLLGSKHLDSLPPRVLRFRLRLARFDFSIEHTPGKYLYTADTLSRAPLSSSDDDPNQGVLAELAMEACIAHIPASQSRLSEYEEAQNSDPLCSLVIKYCHTGWPGKQKVDEALAPYWEAQGDLTLHGNLLLYGTRIVVPSSMQRETLTKLHEGHQGIERCRQRVRISVWWPGVSKEMKFVRNSPHCTKESSPRKEPLLSTSLPEYPWQKLGTDLFTLDGTTYIVVTDYFSRYPEVIKLTSTTSSAVISVLKSLFSRHGIPQDVMSDNGPQYPSQEFTTFAKTYGFKHTTSSPHFPQSNGHAE